MSDERHPLAPYLYLLSAAVIWGASPIIMKLLMGASMPATVAALRLAGQMPPSTVVAVRYLLATLGLAPFAIPIVLRARPSADVRDWLELLGVGVLGSGVGALLFVYAVKLGSPGIVNALSKSQPIFVVLLALLLLRERITSLRVVLIGIMLGASVLIVAGELSVAGREAGLGPRLLGDLLALLAGLSWALAVILGKSALRRFPPEFVAFSRLGVGAVVNSAFAFSFVRGFSFQSLNPTQWALLLALGLICGSFALVLYYRGLQRVEAHVAGSLGLVESVITIILAVSILREPLNALHVAGISLLLFGAYLIVGRAAQAPAAVFDEGGPALGYEDAQAFGRRPPRAERGPLAALLPREIEAFPGIRAEAPVGAEPPFGLRLKITSLCVGLVVAIMCVSSSLIVRHTYGLIRRDITLTMATLTDQIGQLSVVASPPSWQTYRQYLQRLVNRRIVGEDYDIRPVFIIVRDENDVVQAFAFNSREYRLVDTVTGEPYSARHPAAALGLLQRAQKDELKAFDIRLSKAVYGNPPQRIVDVGFRQSISHLTLNRLATINGAIGLAFALLGLFLSAKLAGHLTHPIETLTAAMERVGAGDLEQEVDIRTSDELAMMGGRFNQMVVGLRERAFLKAALTRYVSVQVAEKMLAEGTWLFAPEEREVTVMFSDIRGFTPLSERLSPGEVFDLLNEHFGVMVDIIFAHGGTLDKFIGDCIMAVWGSPQVIPDHALRAVRAGVAMQQALAEVNARRLAAGQQEVRMGVGINTGMCFAGSLGALSEDVRRLEYAVIGDDVNLAQRIESQTAPMQVLISQSTYEEVKEHVLAEPLPPIVAKGKREPVIVYRVLGLRSSAAPGSQEPSWAARAPAAASLAREDL